MNQDMNPKAKIHAEWKKVKAKRERLENELWGTGYRPVYYKATAKEWKEALEKEKSLMELLRKKD